MSLLSAGGDGTLNQVLNGIMSITHQNTLPALGLIPLGSGNDFANSANLHSRFPMTLPC
jgi:diacylglycerol kinase (ATP)